MDTPAAVGILLVVAADRAVVGIPGVVDHAAEENPEAEVLAGDTPGAVEGPAVGDSLVAAVGHQDLAAEADIGPLGYHFVVAAPIRRVEAEEGIGLAGAHVRHHPAAAAAASAEEGGHLAGMEDRNHCHSKLRSSHSAAMDIAVVVVAAAVVAFARWEVACYSFLGAKEVH